MKSIEISGKTNSNAKIIIFVVIFGLIMGFFAPIRLFKKGWE